MKTKILFSLVAVLFMSLLFTINAAAQQPAKILPANTTLSKTGNYTYRITDGPNNQYTYEILDNKKPVFHQSLLFSSAPQILPAFKQQQAQKAALFCIIKIKNGKPPSLTIQEMKALGIN